MSILKQTWTIVLYERPLHLHDTVLISGDEFHYLINVLRFKTNDTVAVSNGAGIKATGMITTLRKKECEVHITQLSYIPPAKPHRHLILAQLKQSALEEAVCAASEIGIHAIHIFPSERTFSKQPVKLEKLQRISNEAIRISKSAYGASIHVYNSLDECVHTLQKEWDKICFLFCDEDSQTPILEFTSKKYEHMTAICPIVGPEASFSLQERQKILNLPGCFSVSLGQNILKAQTAVACASFACCHAS